MSPDDLRRVEALLFSAGRSVPEDELAAGLDRPDQLPGIIAQLQADYADRGVGLTRAAGGWALRSRPEASDLAATFIEEPRRLTRAALETLAIVACYQPVTRSEIERVRGVQLSPGVFDQLLAAGFVKPGPRRDTPGRPLTWTTTTEFLEGFDLMSVDQLDTFRQMKEEGLLQLPPLKGVEGLEPIDAQD